MADPRKKRGPVSRTPSRAPRKIAGHAGGQRPVPEAPTETPTEPITEAITEATDPDETNAGEPEVARDESGDDAGPGRERRLLGSARATRVLAGALALLLLVGIAELVYLFALDGDDEPEAGPNNAVAAPMAQWRTATEQAASSVTDVLSVSWKEYEENLEESSRLMTDDFAKEYATTTDDSKARFLSSKAEYDFAVVGQSVVRASGDEVTTLLFLNQFVYKGEGKQRTGPEIYQVRVEATMVRDGDTWLIDDLQAL